MERRRIVASAPTKLILFGEHFVVYGAPGIAVPISPRNHVEITASGGEPGLLLDGEMGNLLIKPDGSMAGDTSLRMFGAAYGFALEKGLVKNERLDAIVKLDKRCKGIGNSSSIGAALGLAIAASTGNELTNDELFECAQRVDEIAHGNRPSGIDARTVVEGTPQVFTRLFSPKGFDFNRAIVKVPKSVHFLVIDTFSGKRSTTGELLKVFAEAVGANGLPEEIGEEERARIRAPYVGIYERAREIVPKGTPNSAKALGELMNENHELLRERDVSTEEIELVRGACLKTGALGVKISGAGGVGGAVVALVSEKSEKAATASVKELGYSCFPVRLARTGAVLEK